MRRRGFRSFLKLGRYTNLGPELKSNCRDDTKMATSKHMLTFEEVRRLDEILGTVIQVHGRGNFPTLEVKPNTFIKLLLSKLRDQEIIVNDVRLNGSTASYILNDDEGKIEDLAYNDLDLIFNVELKSMSHFHQVKAAVLDSLKDFLPEGVSKERMSSCTLKEAYVRKMVKVTNKPDNWSLITLTNKDGRNIELKFVDAMRRQFEFSIDSFQVILDSLINFYNLTDVAMSTKFYPSVEAVSVYGDFDEAKYHLLNKLIATKNPEEIRGGGLLKYCNLLAKNFTPVSKDFRSMEKYMCSRFFIDFKNIYCQQQKLGNYLNSHFTPDSDKKYKYLMILYEVVELSTVCLMGHERRQTLQLISNMADQLYNLPNYQQITVFYSVPNQSYLNNNSQEYVMVGKWESNQQNMGKSVTCY